MFQSRSSAGVLFLVFLITLVTTTAPAQTKTLHLASTAWSSFTNDPGKARFALDLVHTALERIGIQAETTIIDESRLTSSLLAGEFQGSAALWREEARARALLYSQPYLENQLVLVGRSGSDVSAKSLTDKLFTGRASPDVASPKFYLGGKVYPSWSSVPDGYKANRPPGTFTNGTQITIFSFKF